MKLLLTSGGISNLTIENELKKLLNKDNFKAWCGIMDYGQVMFCCIF